jgi:very-short-patch-repair endonuclease
MHLASSDRTFSASRGWQDIAALATRQYGVVSLSQLVALGARPSTVRGWAARGMLVRLHREVFAVGHAALQPKGHVMAGVLAGGERATLSHRSAGGYHSIRHPPSSFVEITVPHTRGRHRIGLKVHTSALASDEVIHDDIPCTTVARTLIDLAAVESHRGLEAAVETAERLEVFDLRSVSLLLGRHRGRRGVARLRAVLAAFDAEVVRARTETEARLFHLCIDNGFPPPQVNRFVDAGSERYEVDFQWPAARLIVEVDSPYHDSTAARKRDAIRDATLRRYGWTVIRCRWADIVDHPERLLMTLRSHLASARCL